MLLKLINYIISENMLMCLNNVELLNRLIV